MRATIYCAIPADADQERIGQSIAGMQAQVAEYVPGYRLSTDPVFDAGRVAVFVEVEGAGDYLPTYAGNLDIMTAAALRVGEQLATLRLHKGASA
jgi:acetaldehyde dehydrogenase